MDALLGEKERLQRISEASMYSSGVMEAAISYCFKVASRHIRGEAILEMGPAEGVMTGLLAASGRKLTVVEGSAFFCKRLKERFPGVEVVNALFEEFQPEAQFDTIVLSHVLEHVEDPVDVLRRAGRWLKPRAGRLFAAVPNARSLHRQAAVIMGMLPSEDALNEMDIRHGHRRVFSPESFRNLFYKAGLNISVFGGYWLKPVSNRQIGESWTPEMVDAFMRLGERYPDTAGEIYVVSGAEEADHVA